MLEICGKYEGNMRKIGKMIWRKHEEISEKYEKKSVKYEETCLKI